MTDRVNVLHVALVRDMRDDDVQPVIDAIRQMRCVADVQAHIVSHPDYAARSQLSHAWSGTIWDVLIALRDGRKVTIEEPRK